MISLDETIAQRLANYSVTEKLEYCKETVLNSLEQWKRVSDQTAVTIEVILSYLGQDASIPPETLYQWRQALDTHPDANRIDQARSQAKRYLAQYEITNTRLKKLWNGKGFEDLEPGDTVFPVRAMPMIMKMAETTGFEDVSGRLERQKDRRLAAGRSKRTTIQPRDVQAVLQDLQVKDAASAKQLSSPLNQSVPIDHQPMSTSTNRMSSAMKPDLVDQPTLNHSTAGPSKQSPFSDESFAYRNLADDELDTSTTRQPLPIPHTSMDQPVPVNASTSSYQASCIDQAIPTNGASSANQASPTSHPTAAPDGARPTSPKPLRKRRKAVDGTYHGLNKPQRKSPGRRWSTSSSDSNVSSTASIELPRKDQTSLSKADELMDERDITAVGLVSDEVSHTQDQDAVEKNRTAIETTDGWSDLADLPAGVFPEDGASMLGGTLDGPSSPISPPSRSVSPRLPSHSPSIDAAAQRRALQERELETLKSAEGRLDDRLLMKLLDLEVKDSEPVMLIDTLQSKLTATAIPSQPRRSRAKKSVLLLLPHHCPESELWVLYVFFPSTKRLEYYDSLYDADRRERHLAPIQACLSRLLDEECICRATTGQVSRDHTTSPSW